MSYLDVDRLRSAPLAKEPFDHVVVPGFLRIATLADVARDFPPLDLPGSFPASVLRYGPAFAAVLRELEGPAMREAIAGKFAMDLSGRPTMVTVRGQARASDGKIHRDSKTKLVTVLVYMNEAWEAPGGRLRLLRSATDIEDMAVEVPPDAGTLLAFRCTENAWHGHKPAQGPRRSIQLNWVTDAGVVRREQVRHRLSARVKQLRRAVGL